MTGNRLTAPERRLIRDNFILKLNLPPTAAHSTYKVNMTPDVSIDVSVVVAGYAFHATWGVAGKLSEHYLILERNPTLRDLIAYKMHVETLIYDEWVRGGGNVLPKSGMLTEELEGVIHRKLSPDTETNNQPETKEESMIEIISTKGDSRYASDSVAIEVTHTFNKDHLAKVIRLAAERYGKDFVAESAGLKPSRPDSSPTYFVSVDGKSAPKHPHFSLANAEKEAKRILSTSDVPTTARVLQQVKAYQSQSSIKEI